MLVLLYHGVRPDDDQTSPDIRMKHLPRRAFERQMQFLKRFGIPVPLADVVKGLTDGTPLPTRGFCITFDDGYLNNAQVAAPILKKLGIPATFFVTTGFIDGTTRLWVDRFETAFTALPSSSETDATVRSRLKRLPPQERETILREMEERAGTASLVHPLHRPMTWEDVRSLVRDGFEIGAHTVTHPILSTLTDEVQQHEIETSKKRIEDETGQSCRSFAFPNGQPNDWNERTLDIIKDAGLTSSLTTVDGAVRRSDGAYCIRRTTIDTGDLWKFALTVTGIRSTLHGLRTRVHL